MYLTGVFKYEILGSINNTVCIFKCTCICIQTSTLLPIIYCLYANANVDLYKSLVLNILFLINNF